MNDYFMRYEMKINDLKFQMLRDIFGYSNFKNNQEKIIDSILSGNDTICIMETGSGKSLCYQLPALIFDGMTIVITPLISLMQNQVEILKSKSVRACFINHNTGREDLRSIEKQVITGECKILYVAPERLKSRFFISMIKKTEVSMIAVDEAHCISQWGYNFRPDYLNINSLLGFFDSRPIICAFTATATNETKEDIIKNLELKNPVIFDKNSIRRNLCFSVIHSTDKKKQLLKELKNNQNKSGIIYCSTRKTVENIYDYILLKGFCATKYHAGMDYNERELNQQKFLKDDKTIMVSTNAFGMGIDKENISFIIHYNMPKSLEGYCQETGRAGRNGELAKCILLYNSNDISTNLYLIESANHNSNYEKQLLNDYKGLHKVIEYCKCNKCLQVSLNDYFGYVKNENCNICGNCIKKHHSPINTIKFLIGGEAKRLDSLIRQVNYKITDFEKD